MALVDDLQAALKKGISMRYDRADARLGHAGVAKAFGYHISILEIQMRALSSLLISQNVITQQQWNQAQLTELQAEVASYEALLETDLTP